MHLLWFIGGENGHLRYENYNQIMNGLLFFLYGVAGAVTWLLFKAGWEKYKNDRKNN